MKNTLPMRIRVLPFVYRVLLSNPTLWLFRVLIGVVVSVLMILALPLLVVGVVGCSVCVIYMSVFDQAGIDRLAERAKSRKLRQGEDNDELRDQISTN